MDKNRLLELAGLKVPDVAALNESVGSEISRKVSGKLSGKEHARSIGINKLQLIERMLHPKELRAMFEDMDEGQIKFFNEVRQEAIDGIKTLKSIEK